MRAPASVSQADWEAMSHRMLRAARHLLVSQEYETAYYLAGYAIEFALKCRIMHVRGLGTWPSRKAMPAVHVHELEDLARLAGVEPQLAAWAQAGTGLGLAWLVVKDWSPAVRYYPGPFPRSLADDMLDAADTSGLQAWLIP